MSSSALRYLDSLLRQARENASMVLMKAECVAIRVDEYTGNALVLRIIRIKINSV